MRGGVDESPSVVEEGVAASEDEMGRDGGQASEDEVGEVIGKKGKILGEEIIEVVELKVGQGKVRGTWSEGHLDKADSLADLMQHQASNTK